MTLYNENVFPCLSRTFALNCLTFLLLYVSEFSRYSGVECSILLVYSSFGDEGEEVMRKESSNDLSKEEARVGSMDLNCEAPASCALHKGNRGVNPLERSNVIKKENLKESSFVVSEVLSKVVEVPAPLNFRPADSDEQESNLLKGRKKRVVCIGAGSWGTTVARLISTNVKSLEGFHDEVILQIHDELIPQNGSIMLSQIINAKHENVKYLPGVALPHNIVAEPSIDTALKKADVVVFGVPDQFVRSVANSMKNKMKDGAWIVNLTKGLEFENNKLKPITYILSDILSKPQDEICVLSGANLAFEVSNDEFSEATLACKSPEILNSLIPIFNRSTFRVSGITNVEGPQMCGALKNVMALGKGILDGLKNKKKIKFGMNSEAAFTRIALKEILNFNRKFFEIPESIYFESCCIADLITTFAGGRHRKTAEKFAFHDGNISFEVLEKQILNGQKLQGTYVISQIHDILEKHSISNEFPIMSAVYKAIYEKAKPEIVYEAMMMV